MGFDPELARALLEEVDRDTAAFFAGRRAEIERFDEALRAVERRFERNQRALFLVYQGAPGCGKTSLVSHLRKARPEEIGLLVNVRTMCAGAQLSVRRLLGVDRQLQTLRGNQWFRGRHVGG